MMLRKNFRLPTTIVALLHLLVAGFGPLLDARLEASENETATHVEAERAAPCATGHDHFFCQVCRTVSEGRVLASDPIRPGPVSIAVSRTPAGTWVPSQSPFDILAHGPRAPPLA